MSLPLPALKPGGKSNLDNLLREKIAEKTVPSIFWAATNAKEQIYENQVGNVIMGDESSDEVNRDTTLEMFSMTKFITCLAILQFIEKGVLDLDNPDQMYTHLPELGTLQVLEGYDDDGKAILVPQRNRITLRMLMDHTSGSVHALRNPKLKQWFDAQSPPIPWLFTSGASVRTICAPLIFQPGTSWAYSCGTDWIGILINRLSGLTLEEYLKENIFARVEGSMPDTTFYPRPDLVARKAGVYERLGDGSLEYHNIWKDRAQTPETVSKEFLSGAGGLFGTTKDYLALCRAVLQCDPRNPTPPKQPIIQSQTFKLLFEPSLILPKAKSEASQFFKNEHYLLLEPNPDNVNHSVGFAMILQDGNHGRKAGSGGWSGMAHTHFWLDPTTGLAGVCNTQICGPNPDPWNKIYNAFERTLYENLQHTRSD